MQTCIFCWMSSPPWYRTQKEASVSDRSNHVKNSEYRQLQVIIPYQLFSLPLHCSMYKRRLPRTLPTVPLRCRLGRAWAFQWSLGLYGRATHAWGPKWDSRPRGIQGLRHARLVEVRLRDASAHQTWLNQRRRNSGRGPHLFRSNDISFWSCTWYLGHLKEWAGFLVSRSLTLSSAHRGQETSFDNIPRWPKKEKKKGISRNKFVQSWPLI